MLEKQLPGLDACRACLRLRQRRLVIAVQELRVGVEATWPNHRPALSVDADLGEVRGIAKGLSKSAVEEE